MADERIVLRDEDGGEAPVTRGSDGAMTIGADTWRVRAAVDGSLILEGDGQRQSWTAETGRTRWVFIDGEVYVLEAVQPAARRRQKPQEHGPVLAPMPSTVRSVAVAAGTRVQRGDVLVVLEAMKMELPIRAGADGHVERVNCRTGELVQAGEELVRIAPLDPPGGR